MSRPPHPLTTPFTLRLSSFALAGALAVSAGAGLVAPAARAVTTDPASEVSWLDVAGEGDVDAAFASARTQNKPVLLYWGAKWCPPCNQLKATLFNRQDFIARSRSVVALHLDGDVPAAQKLGTRFKVRGYPTMILFSPDGKELTRLPGEADPLQVLQVLELGMSSGRPIQQVLADARAGKPLGASEWQLLAFYSWDTDDAALVPEKELPGVLASLARACPPTQAQAGTRLLLKSLAASADDKPAPAVEPAVRERVDKLLADATASRSQMDVLTNSASDLVKALAPQPGGPRNALVARVDATLRRLQADSTLSRADRMTALYSRVDLARMDAPRDALHPKLDGALIAEVRKAVRQADAEITDAYERQAVITEAASLLSEAGLWSESDALLKANLARSHSPYYLMSELGANARKQGRVAQALDWYRQAFERSEGPATRLQWGASYLSALVELAPKDARRIEQVAGTVIGEAATQPNAFYERSARSLQRVSTKLLGWNKGNDHAAELRRLQAQLDGVCARLPAGDTQRGTCEGLLKATATKG